MRNLNDRGNQGAIAFSVLAFYLRFWGFVGCWAFTVFQIHGIRVLVFHNFGIGVQGFLGGIPGFSIEILDFSFGVLQSCAGYFFGGACGFGVG